MLQFKDEVNYLISMRHYFHKTKAVIETVYESMLNTKAELLNRSDVDDAFCDEFREALNPLHDRLSDMIDTIDTVLTHDIHQHAHTLKGHTQFMKLWNDKLNTMYIQCVRQAHKVDDFLDAKHDVISPDVERIILTLIENMASGATANLELHEFIDESNTRRSERLAQIQDKGSNATLSDISSVFRSTSDVSVTETRKLVNSQVIKIIASFTAHELLELDNRSITRLITPAIESVYTEMSTIITSTIRDNLQSEEPAEIGSFINTCIKPAINRAFSVDTHKRSCVVSGVTDTVNEYIQEECGNNHSRYVYEG